MMPDWLAPVLTWLAPLVAAPFLVPPALRWINKVWIRPIIQVQLDDSADCHGRTPLRSNGKVVGQVMYLRLRIRNRGQTTLKDCFGNLLTIRVWDEGGKVFVFDREVLPRGWAHHPHSKQRNIARGDHWPLDAASLRLSPDEKHNQLYWPDPLPTNMIQFIESLPPGKATYLFEIRVNADNARPRSVPVQFVFDPACSYLSFVPFDTRYPGWRWRWSWTR
jgi:hypothetical protein